MSIYGLSDGVSLGNQMLGDVRNENEAIINQNSKNMDNYTLANKNEKQKRQFDDYMLGGSDSVGVISGLRSMNQFRKSARAYDPDGTALHGWANMARDNISGGSDPKEWLKNNKNVPMAEGDVGEDTFKSSNVSDVVPASKGATAPSAKLSEASVSTPDDYVSPADPRTTEPLVVDSGDMIPRRSYATYKPGKLFPLDPTGSTISGAGAEADGSAPSISGQDAPQLISNPESGGRGPRPPTEPRPAGLTPSGQQTGRTPIDRTGGQIVRSPAEPTSDGAETKLSSVDSVASRVGVGADGEDMSMTSKVVSGIAGGLESTTADLIGKSVGNAGAIIDGVEGVDNLIRSKGKEFFDKNESGLSRAGDITQMTGAGLDFLSVALPFLAPIAIATNVAGAIMDSAGKIDDDKTEADGIAAPGAKKQAPLASSQGWADMGMVASAQSDPIRQIQTSSAF